jgi:hypothetical protein
MKNTDQQDCAFMLTFHMGIPKGKNQVKRKSQTWTFAPVTILGLSYGNPATFCLFCQLCLNAKPASIASDDPLFLSQWLASHPQAVRSTDLQSCSHTYPAANCNSIVQPFRR